jgi:uncharacterized protein (TIGR04255 family)
MNVARLRELRQRPRVIYAMNPLVEVISAIRLPLILALLHEPPAELQKRIAKAYPFAEVKQMVPQLFIGPQPVPRGDESISGRAYSFANSERTWRITLEPTLVALTCSKYSTWEEFRARFAEILDLIFAIYKVSAITRVGLRYRDIIDRETLKLGNQPWSALIERDVLGTFEYFTNELEGNPPYSATIELTIPPGKVRVQVATVQNATGGDGFLIDTDCYSETERVADARQLLAHSDELHEYTRTIFQACITDRLHDALGPREIGKG